MFDWISFETEPGGKKEKEVKVLALSTCAFCARGMEFLKKHDIEYKYIYVDTFSKEDRKKISEEFKEKFKQRGLFPTLIIDEKDFQLGFIEKAWTRSLGLE